MLGENAFDILEDLVGLDLRIDIVVLIELRIVLYDLLGLTFIGEEALLYAVEVVVRAAAGLSPLQQTVEHDFLPALQVQDEGQLDFVVHDAFPGGQVLDIAREAVDQKPSPLESSLPHCLLQQHHRDLARHDLALDYVAFDDCSILGSRSFAFLPHKVTSREVGELELLVDALALGALA